MKVKVDRDEYWPYYLITGINNPYAVEIEITEEEFKQIEAAEQAFKEAQKVLGRAFPE